MLWPANCRPRFAPPQLLEARKTWFSIARPASSRSTNSASPEMSGPMTSTSSAVVMRLAIFG